MASLSSSTDFTVWGADQAAYGPVQLPDLVAWISSQRVTAETWIFDAKRGKWCRAAEIPELHIFFRPGSRGLTAGELVGTPLTGLDPIALRRVKILSDLNDEQVLRFVQFTKAERIPSMRVIVKQGECDDSMYLILDGEFRVRVNVAGKETILTTLAAGQFFGDISLFDHGPRSADVVANTEGTLLKITSGDVRRMAHEAPDLALPFLMAVGRTLAARIRFDNKRYCESVEYVRVLA
jgi:hypothetical protein